MIYAANVWYFSSISRMLRNPANYWKPYYEVKRCLRWKYRVSAEFFFPTVSDGPM